MTAEFWKSKLKILWRFVGFGLLAALLYRVGTIDLSSILHPVTLLILLTAPPWIMMSAVALNQLLPKKLSIPYLARLDVIAESMGSLIPSGGMAGEPWRLLQIAPQVGGTGPTTKSLLSYRVVHAYSGLIDIFVTTTLSLHLMTWNETWKSSLTTAATGSAAGALGLLLVYLLAPAVRKRFCPPMQLLGALTAKLVGRTLLLSEVVVIFYILGIDITLGRVLSVAAMIITSGSLVPMIPNGVGVVEMGITLVFEQLGLPGSMGLTFGLIRQAGNLCWTLIGSLMLLSWRAQNPEQVAAIAHESQ